MNNLAFTQPAMSAKLRDVSIGKYFLASLLTMITICHALYCAAQGAPKKTLLALSKNNHTLAIVDPVTFKVLAKLPVGSDPHEVIASDDGKLAFVTIYGGGSLHELDVLDLVAQKSMALVDTRPFMGPHGAAFANGKVWITTEGSKTVESYNPATGKFDWTMGTGQDRTHMIYVTPDGKRVYTSNVNSGTISILQDTLVHGFGPPNTPPHEQWMQTVIPVGRGSEGFDVSPDGKELWTAASDDGAIYIIDLVNKKASGKIDAKVMGANRLKFTPDGKRVLVSSLRTGDVVVLDAITHQEIKRISTGHGAAGILVDTDGSRAFIGCSADNYVAVIDLNTLQVTGHIDVGGVPDGLAWAVRQ